MSGEEGMTRRSVLKNAAVGGASLIGVTGFATGKKKQSDVSQRDARKIAKKAVGHIGTRTEFDTWCEQGVKSPELFYAKVADGDSIVYTPRAWVFPIENRGDDVGYIAIDAKQTVSPVLAYGKSEAPQRNVDDAMQVAKANGNSIHKRFLYQGGTQFGVETTDRRVVDLRNQSVTSLAPVEDRQSLLPSDKSGLQSSSNIGGGDAPDWSGGTDGKVSGEVPNWTEDDDGGASITNYGDGADSWDGWDGCTPIAASMVIGYHEGLNDDDQDQADALIDRLHVDLGTNDNGVTLPEPPRNPFDLASQENNIYDNIRTESKAMKKEITLTLQRMNTSVCDTTRSKRSATITRQSSQCGTDLIRAQKAVIAWPSLDIGLNRVLHCGTRCVLTSTTKSTTDTQQTQTESSTVTGSVLCSRKSGHRHRITVPYTPI